MSASKSRAIELHDSHIEFVVPNGTDTTIELNPAYLHESTGTPGIDEGVGYLQNVHLQLSGTEIKSHLTDLPARVQSGWIKVGDCLFDNIVPLPIIHVGTTELELRTDKDELLKLRANGLVLILSGERKQLERFEPQNDN